MIVSTSERSRLSVLNSLSGGHRELDQVPAVGDPAVCRACDHGDAFRRVFNHNDITDPLFERWCDIGLLRLTPDKITQVFGF
jgi:hypothetical protein